MASKRAVAAPAVQALYNLITTQAITPFFFEGILNLEAIPKKARKAYLQSYKPSITMAIDKKVEHHSQGTPPSDIPEYLETTIEKAAALGFRFILLPRIGAHGIYSQKNTRHQKTCLLETASTGASSA